MTTRILNLLLRLYPADHRAEFEAAMRAVFLALIADREGRFAWTEYLGLIRGALREHYRDALEHAPLRAAVSMAGGALFACALHLALYRSLLERVLKHFVAFAFVFSLGAAISSAQPQVLQDPAVLELARSIYRDIFTEMRNAKTLDDMRKLADREASPDWISVDRFGRTGLTRQNQEQEFASILALPPDRRITEMDIIWAERDSSRLMVVAWMMPHEGDESDSAGAKHRVTRGTLIRDIFARNGDGWLRIQHDKLVPNDMVLAIDGVPSIVPPMNERNRVTPVK